jgi:hypothetical protein
MTLDWFPVALMFVKSKYVSRRARFWLVKGSEQLCGFNDVGRIPTGTSVKRSLIVFRLTDGRDESQQLRLEIPAAASQQGDHCDRPFS